MEPDLKVNEDFKSQFKAYQEQQQRRLQNLMERKKEKQNSQKNSGSTKEAVRALSDLNLFKRGPPLKEDASKSLVEAENEQLQNELREVRDENCRLYKLVSEKDFEIKQLQKRVQEERLALSGVSGLAGDVAATKIVELAKKNREMTAEFESERARVKQLNHKVKELERELQAATEKIHSLGGDASGIKESTLKMLEGNLAESPEVKALQEKLSTANVKVTEYRNQLQNVKQELKLTQKVLSREVGEDVNIQSLLTNSGSWRGRAQQILLLQTRVQELEHKLSHNKIRASLLEAEEGFLEFADPRKLSVQEKNLLKIRSLEKEKKESLEKLTEQHKTLQKSHEELKKKLDASKARNQVLCGEVKMLKEQIKTLLDKGKHDDELIDALLSQQKQMQEILKGLNWNQQMQHPGQVQDCRLGQLRKLAAEGERTIETLMSETIEKLTLGDKASAAHPPQLEESDSSKAGRTKFSRTVSTMGHELVESAATEPFLLRDSIPSGRFDGTGSSSWEVLMKKLTEQMAVSQAAEVDRSEFLKMLTELQERMSESSNEISEAEKFEEEQQRSDFLDPESSRAAQKAALRKGKAQPSLPSCVGDREELPAALPELPLESQVEELSIGYVLPFSMLGLLFPSSGRGGAGAQSALSQGSHKITTAPGFHCLF
uniref:Coiled-coil domain-containing protein 13 n=1 Tax=Catharus ustulatus TaxID=91951 RepID=A0A8C3TXX4_CATUS